MPTLAAPIRTEVQQPTTEQLALAREFLNRDQKHYDALIFAIDHRTDPNAWSELRESDEQLKMARRSLAHICSDKVELIALAKRGAFKAKKAVASKRKNTA